MTSDALVAMIERKLQAYGLEKVVPDEDLLAETYRAFHRSQQLRERFEEMEQQFDKEAAAADIPEDLEQRVRAVLAEHADLRWDDAIQLVLDETQLSRVRAEKEKAKKKSGDFTSDDPRGSVNAVSRLAKHRSKQQPTRQRALAAANFTPTHNVQDELPMIPDHVLQLHEEKWRALHQQKSPALSVAVLPAIRLSRGAATGQRR